jgi:predicted nucleic acid-binding protein
MDCCVAIYLIEGELGHRSKIDKVIDALDVEIFASDLVRMETFVGPLRKQDAALLQAYQNLFQRLPCIGFEPATFDHAAQIRATYNLRTPDALHVAAAMAAECDEFWTNDRNLAAKDLPIRIRLFPAP